MEIQPHPNSIPYALSALVCAGIAVAVWQRRAVAGARYLFAHLLGVSLWSGAYAALWLSTSEKAQVFWLEFAGLWMALIAAAFLPFVFAVTHNERLINRRLFRFLGVVPLIGLILTWTNDAHHLVHSDTALWTYNGLAKLAWQPGAWFLGNYVYTATIFGIGAWLLARSISQNGNLHRRQVSVILVGAILPACAIAVFLIAQAASLEWLDMSPPIFSVSGLLYFYAITRRRFLDLLPVAHATLIERMTDGVIVLDAQDRVVEMNPAAGQFLELDPRASVGRHAREILAGWEAITRPFFGESKVRTEIIVSQKEQRYIDLNVAPLADRKGLAAGRVLVFRDITARKRNEADLRQANDLLQAQIAEISNLQDELREQATRDPLTNLYNRRYLVEMLSQELARAHRENYPVCLIMLDIDRFKRVNDTCGHKAGDETLLSLGALIVQHIRRFDAACRYGGEEFVIVMPKLEAGTARERAEYLRREFASQPVFCEEMESHPTLSIGISVFPSDATNSDQLLNAADKALYAAKDSGRNRIVVYSEMRDGRELANAAKP